MSICGATLQKPVPDLNRSSKAALRVPKLPVSQKSDLRRRLDEALKNENYELAAILRDELRLLES